MGSIYGRDKRVSSVISELTWVHSDTGVRGGHGKDGSGQFHNELKDIIDNSNSLDEFNSSINNLIERWQIDPSVVPSLELN